MSNVSIVMPAYNSEAYIAQAIESIIQQTFQQFELIVIDDCSQDGTVAIAQSFVQRYPDQIRLVRHDQNKGVAAARNTGILHSRYDILMMADTDDIQLPQRLQITYETLQQQQADVILHDCYMIDSLGHSLQRTKGYPADLRTDNVVIKLLERNYFWTSLSMFRKNEHIYFDERLPSSEDYDLFLRLAIQGYTFVICPELLTAYRVHEHNLSAKVGMALQATRYILSKLDIPSLYSQLCTQHSQMAADEAIAAVHLWLNQPDQALTLLCRHSHLSFNSSFALAICYYKLHDYERSLAQFEKLAESDSEASNASLWNNIGALKMLLRHNQALALPYIEKALALRSDYQDAQHNWQLIGSAQTDGLRVTERPLRREIVHTDHYKLSEH
ncbi:glycosyltransferase [Paenibacillus sp. SGZ-1009]|uniref:glycosyltransferase n=1 Tax=Paenibacillus campi TaxID=3106031 RepID=UPI002AFFF27C|nr:glycosyltransferase [Paenibacillus sp. SGZ-1009]